MDPLWWLIPIGVAAGFIDSMVGGGGVLTLPALLAAGLPPHVAIGTNKVAGTGASSMATLQFARLGQLEPGVAWGLFPVAVAASVMGAMTVLRLPDQFILGMVAVVIVAMVVYVLFRPTFGKTDRFTGMRPALWLGLAGWVALIAFYDGLLGPGTGSMLLFGIVAILGMGFVKGAAHARVYNFGSNVGALALFWWADVIDWRLGLGMMVGTMAGAWIGSHATVKHGDRWIKPLFVLMAVALLARILSQ